MSYSAGVVARVVPSRGGYIPKYDGSLQKLDYATDTVFLIGPHSGRPTLYRAAGIANKNVGGYIAGGLESYASSTISKLSFVNESTRLASITLSTGVYFPTPLSNHGVAGYSAGGASGYSGSTYGFIDKIAYASDTQSMLSASLSSAKLGLASASNSGVFGYLMAGATSASTINGSTVTNTIDKLTYSNESRSTIGATLTYPGFQPSISSNQGIAAYMMSIMAWLGGNYDASYTFNVCDKISYTTDTRSQVSPYNLGNIDSGCYGLSNQAVAGYHCTYGRAYKFNFSTETKAEMAAVFTDGGSRAGMSNSL